MSKTTPIAFGRHGPRAQTGTTRSYRGAGQRPGSNGRRRSHTLKMQDFILPAGLLSCTFLPHSSGDHRFCDLSGVRLTLWPRTGVVP